MTMFSEDEQKKAKEIALKRLQSGEALEELDQIMCDYMIKIGPPVPLMMLNHERTSTTEQLLDLYKECIEHNKTWEETIQFTENPTLEY